MSRRSVTDAETVLTPVMRNNRGDKGIGFYNYGHSRQVIRRAARSNVTVVPRADNWLEVQWVSVGK